MRIETVTRVINYNTFRTKSRKHSVRLANVQGFYLIRTMEKAKERLKTLIGGKKVGVTTLTRNCFGQSIARISVDGKSVNLIMNKFLRKK